MKLKSSCSVIAATLLFLATSTSTVIASAQSLNRQTFLSDNFATTNNMVRVAFFDADSTLRVSLSGSVSANTPTDVLLLPDVETRIAELVRQGYLVAIVSNQGGVEARIITHEIASGALSHAIRLIAEKNPEAQVQYFDYAERSDNSRKPGRGMGLRLEQKLRDRGLTLDWANSFMVGDSAYKRGVDTRPDGQPGAHFSNADRLFAENLRIPFFEPTDFFGWRPYGVDVFSTAAEVNAFVAAHGSSGLRCAAVFR